MNHPEQSYSALERGNEDFWSTMTVFGNENGTLRDASSLVPRLGEIPDWLLDKTPVSVRTLRVMMVLFFFSVGFVGASSLLGETTLPIFWRKMLVPTICVLVFLAGFLINQIWLVPKYFFKRRFKLFVLFNLLYTIVSLVIRDVSIWLFSGEGTMFLEYIRGGDVRHPLSVGFAMLFVFLMITVVICLFNVLLRLGGIHAQNAYFKSVEKQFFLQADLAFLKQQLSPHFLFNTLNNISALIDLDPVRAQKSMNRLSSVLRQMLNEAKEKEVELGSEIDMLKKYCELEKLRFGENVDFSLEAAVENASWKIAPLLMLPLVENAFKYGVHPANPCRIAILISEKGGLLKCRVENTIVPKAQSSHVKSGIGLANLKRRLDVCYSGRFEYGAKFVNGNYVADLQIDLKGDPG